MEKTLCQSQNKNLKAHFRDGEFVPGNKLHKTDRERNKVKVECLKNTAIAIPSNVFVRQQVGEF
jgi:hypothetical protein